MNDANTKDASTKDNENVADQKPESTVEQAAPPTTPPAAAPVAAVPESAAPETTKPETKEPETAATETREPEAAKPDAVKPTEEPAAAPAVQKPESTKPAAAAPTTEIKFALVVDDEPANRDFLMRLLEQAALDVKGAFTAQGARNIAQATDRMDLVVIDHKLPDGDGVNLMVELHTKFPAAIMVMATMHDERALMDKAFENGCDVFLVKPHGFMELFRRIKTAQATSDVDILKRMIIDQYGPRPYRG